MHDQARDQDAQLERYARHLILKQIGVKGQKALLAGKVLVIGAGGLGSPVLAYLAAAGVGTLGICDGDVVSLSNLQRQILYTTDEIGQPKVECAKRRLSAMNPDVTFELYDYYLTGAQGLELTCKVILLFLFGICRMH